MIAKLAQRRTVPRYSVVLIVSEKYRPQPLPLFRYGVMQASLQFQFNGLQFRPQSLAHRLPPERELPHPGLSTDVREAQEVERLWFTFPASSSVGRCKAPKLDQTRLVGVRFQIKLPQPFAQVALGLLGVGPMIKAEHEAVGVAHHDHVPVGAPLPPFVAPQVED